MAGKRDHIVIAVITGLEDSESGNVVRAIGQAKKKHAPKAFGRAASGNESDVKRLLSRGSGKFLPSGKDK